MNKILYDIQLTDQEIFIYHYYINEISFNFFNFIFDNRFIIEIKIRKNVFLVPNLYEYNYIDYFMLCNKL